MSVPILLYHQIGQRPHPGVPFDALYVSPSRFAAQMHWLNRLGYRGLSMRDAWPYITGQQQDRVAVVTFDDGFRNVLDHAAPVLNALGFTATNYFVANQIGGGNVWDRDIGVPHTPCMTLAQLREWHGLGHEVGAHTLDHVHLETVGLRSAVRQIGDSKRALEDMIGAPVSHFAYPYGEFNLAHARIARESGFASATTTRRARARPQDDRFALPRIYVRRKHSIAEFLARLHLS